MERIITNNNKLTSPSPHSCATHEIVIFHSFDGTLVIGGVTSGSYSRHEMAYVAKAKQKTKERNGKKKEASIDDIK